MVLQRWYPFGDLRLLEPRANRPLHDGPIYERNGSSWGVPLDVVRSGDDIVVSASLPGVSPEDINVAIDEGVLSIEAEAKTESESKEEGYLLRERRSGSFRRSLRLPDSVDSENVKSEYSNGVLSITFPKQEAKKAKIIEVKAA